MANKSKTKYKTFNISEPHASRVIKLAKRDRRSYTETLRIIIDFYEANVEATRPNGHEPCNQQN